MCEREREGARGRIRFCGIDPNTNLKIILLLERSDGWTSRQKVDLIRPYARYIINISLYPWATGSINHYVVKQFWPVFAAGCGWIDIVAFFHV